jgi:pilus assembly protein Flp/PilA
MITVTLHPFTDRQAPMREQKEFAMKNLMSSFLKDETAATAIEYGLIAAGISVAIIAVVQGLGTNLKTTFGSVSTALK